MSNERSKGKDLLPSLSRKDLSPTSSSRNMRQNSSFTVKGPSNLKPKEGEERREPEPDGPFKTDLDSAKERASRLRLMNQMSSLLEDDPQLMLSEGDEKAQPNDWSYMPPMDSPRDVNNNSSDTRPSTSDPQPPDSPTSGQGDRYGQGGRAIYTWHAKPPSSKALPSRAPRPSPPGFKAQPEVLHPLQIEPSTSLSSPDSMGFNASRNRLSSSGQPLRPSNSIEPSRPGLYPSAQSPVASSPLSPGPRVYSMDGSGIKPQPAPYVKDAATWLPDSNLVVGHGPSKQNHHLSTKVFMNQLEPKKTKSAGGSSILADVVLQDPSKSKSAGGSSSVVLQDPSKTSSSPSSPRSRRSHQRLEAVPSNESASAFVASLRNNPNLVVLSIKDEQGRLRRAASEGGENLLGSNDSSPILPNSPLGHKPSIYLPRIKMGDTGAGSSPKGHGIALAFSVHQKYRGQW